MFPSPIGVFHNIIQLHVLFICNKGVKITYSQFSLDYFTVQLLIRLSCMKGFKIDNYLHICTDAAQNSIILIFSTLYLSLLTLFFLSFLHLLPICCTIYIYGLSSSLMLFIFYFFQFLLFTFFCVLKTENSKYQTFQ